MSCTLTMNMPEDAVSFVTRKGLRSNDELGAIFVDFLTERMGYVPPDADNPFVQFCGTWDKAQFDEFQGATERTVNAEEWM